LKLQLVLLVTLREELTLFLVHSVNMFPMFRGWPLRGLAIVTYETATRSVAVDQQWTLYTTAPRRHTTVCTRLYRSGNDNFLIQIHIQGPGEIKMWRHLSVKKNLG
jgi:hypothetical protein